MSEPVGRLYYEVALETKALIDAQRRVDRDLKTTASSFDKVTDAQDRQSRSADQLATRLTRIAAAVASLAAATYLVAQSDAYTKLNAQLKLATKSEEDFVKARQSTISISKDAQADLLSIGTLYARISKSTQEMGASQQRVADITKVVALSLKVSGAGAQESASAMLQLSQSFASGVLRGEEFNAVAEAAPRLLQALADGMNVPVGQLRTMAAEGKLTSDILATALPKALKDLEQEAKSVQTISGAFQELRNEIMLFVGEQMQASGASKLMASAIAGLADNVSRLGDYTGSFLAAAQAGAVLFAANMAGRFTTSITMSTSALLANVEATRAAAAAEVMHAKAQQTTAFEAASLANAARATALATTEKAAANLVAVRSEVALAAAEVERTGLAVALARGTQAESAATLVSKLATDRLTAAKVAEAEATAVLAASEEALAVTRAQASAAAAAATASTVALTAAQRAQAAASAIAAAAGRAFGAVMTALGGPVGIAIIGLAALVLNWDKISGSADRAAEISEKAAARIQKALGRNSEAPMRQLMDARDEAQAGIELLDAQIERAEKLAKMKRLGSGRGFADSAGAPDISKLTAQREAYRAALLDSEKAIDDFKAQQMKDLFPDAEGQLKKPPPTKEFQSKAQEAQAYYQALVAENALAYEKINAEEKRALAANQKHMVEDAANAGVYAKAKLEIVKKFARERGLLDERAIEQTAELNIATTADEAERIAAIRDEAFRRADAQVRLSVITSAEAERAKAAAMIAARESFDELAERNARARAERELAVTKDQSAQINMIRDEAIRQAQDGYERGKLTFDEAERAKTKALMDAEAQRLALRNQRSQTQMATLQIRADTTGNSDDQVNLIRARAQAEIDAAEEARQRDLENEQLYVDQKVAIRQRMEMQLQELQAATETAQLAMAQSSAGQVLDILKRAGKERTALGKAAFLAERALAVAQIIINTEVAAAKAGSQLGVFGLPLAGLIRATGYASAGMVAGLAVSDAFGGGRQYGGPVDAGKLYRVNETGQPEMFTASNGSQYMMPTKSGNVTPADQVGGGGGKTTIIIQNTGTPQRVVSQSYDAATQAHKLVMADLTEQFSSNTGQVYNAAVRSTNLRGRL